MTRPATFLDRVGSAGALLAAAAAPCCFPLFAALGATLGLGTLGLSESLLLYLFQGFALLSVVGLAFSFREHHRVGPLTLGACALALVAYHFHVTFSLGTLYAGVFGLLGATLWNRLSSRTRRDSAGAPVLQSVIACPECGHRTEETMPTNACLFFYECPSCRAFLKPKAGDCCVFCSYGTVPCPPIQADSPCCA